MSTTEVICDRCQGSGDIPNYLGGPFQPQKCGNCGGSGHVVAAVAEQAPVNISSTDAAFHIEKLVTYVDPVLTVKELIDTGKYDDVSETIKSTIFCTQRHGRVLNVNFSLLKPDDWMSSREIITGMTQLNLAPATYRELLAFAIGFPDRQRVAHILAFGSEASWKQVSKCYPCLYGDSQERLLDVYIDYDDDEPEFGPATRFLAVSI